VKHNTTRNQPGHEIPRTGGEEGFVLLAVLFLVALILIALAVAAPKVAMSLRRDKELELVHRGEQYKRAIKMYYRKFGSYPANIDQLMNTNQVRFLRKRYTDPFTGKDDWKVIYFGQAHVKPMGLFGQTLTASAVSPGGTGVAGAAFGSGTTTGSASGTSGSAFGSSGSSFGSSSGSSFGSSGSSFGSSSGSSFGSSGSSFGSSTGSNPGSTGSTDGSSGGASPSGFGSSSGGSSFGSSATGTTGTGTGSAFGSTGSTGSTLGGGPIVGVAIPDTHASIKEYKKQKHYNEWEFVYDPIEDQLQASGAALGAGQQNLNGSTGTTGTGFGSSGTSQGGFGSSFGSSTGSSFGSSTGSGTGSGTNPGGTQPQQ
jgi:type II secretory pathway pseudopilin PulG